MRIMWGGTSFGYRSHIPVKLNSKSFDSFSDRDTLLRYHWGMGVGHIHAHGLADVEALPSMNVLNAEIEIEEGDLDNGERSYGTITPLRGWVAPESNDESGSVDQPPRSVTTAGTCEAEVGEDRGPDCEDPALDMGLNYDDLDEGDDDDTDTNEGIGDDTPEIDDDLDDSLYPGL